MIKIKIVTFATKNKAKFNRALKILHEFNIKLKHCPLELMEIRSMDLKEIAISKAIYAFDILKRPLIVLDAGIYIKELNGFPGPYVEVMLKTIGLNGLLEIMKNKINRSVEFKYVLAYIEKTKNPITFEGHETGNIALEMRGNNDKGWSSSFIYIPDGFCKTLAEMTETEYNEYEKKIRSTDPFVKFAQWFITKNKLNL